jgi:ABC-type protease/lipase transport system fused ATPase/permease subunit
MRNPELIESMGMVGPLFRQWMKRHSHVVQLSDTASRTSAFLASANGFVVSSALLAPINAQVNAALAGAVAGLPVSVETADDSLTISLAQ